MPNQQYPACKTGRHRQESESFRRTGWGHRVGGGQGGPATMQAFLKAKAFRRHTKKHQLVLLKKALYFPFK